MVIILEYIERYVQYLVFKVKVNYIIPEGLFVSQPAVNHIYKQQPSTTTHRQKQLFPLIIYIQLLVIKKHLAAAIKYVFNLLVLHKGK